MDNRDWHISDQDATKFFFFENEEAAGRFVREGHRLAKNEHHPLRFRRMKSGEIRVKIPVKEPGKYTEAEVRLMNLINKLGG